MNKGDSRSIDEGALPVFPTDSFIGRQQEIARLQRLLQSSGPDIVTITGPGGVGKTRLALEALRNAEAWSEKPVAIATLAVAQRDEEIVRAIAQGLGIVDHEENLRQRIADTLGGRPHLLLLDNMEHLFDGARETVVWLGGISPETRLLATSRIALGLPAEEILVLCPLRTSSAWDGNDPRQLDSVQLFLDRALASNPRFRIHDGDLQRIAELCDRYDGLPLAIELVASWANVLSPKEMLERHDVRLEDRTGTREERHRSLEDAIRWSYELLSSEEQAFFRRMSLFPGGFSRDLAEGMIRGTSPGARLPRANGYGVEWGYQRTEAFGDRVVPYENHSPALPYSLPSLNLDSARAIASLLDHHLILPAEDVDGVLCFDMLETVRDFGLEELRRLGELDGARQTHAVTMLAFAEMSSDYLWNAAEPQWGVERVMAAMPSVRAALHWLDDQGEPGHEVIVRIAGTLWAVYQTRGLVTEGRTWLRTAMFLPDRLDWLKGTELPALAFLCWIQNDDERALEVVDAALAATERTGLTFAVGLCRLVQALVLYRQPEPDLLSIVNHVNEAEASFMEWEVPHGLVGCRAIFGIVARMLGETQQALDLFEEAHRIATEANYAWGIAITRYFAGETLRELAAEDESRMPEAIAMMAEALSQTWGQGDAWSAGGTLSGLACIRVQRGELIEAARMFGAANTLMQRVGGSLLPADLLTHTDIAESLRGRLGDEAYEHWVARGSADPEAVVEETLNSFEGYTAELDGKRPVRLTARQLAVVNDLAKGLDIAQIAHKRGRTTSATYEIVGRICDRLGVDSPDLIVPAAAKYGLLGSPHRPPGEATPFVGRGMR